MQGDVNLLPGRLGVVGIDIQERIKRRGWIAVQKRLAQSGLADLANGQVLSFVPRVTETSFPITRLKIIGDPSHFTTQPHVKQLVPVSEFFAPWAGVVNTTKPNTSGDRETRSVRKEIWNSRICNGERVPRIERENGHTDAGGTKETVSAWVFEWIRRKGYCCQRRIEKRARIFEIAKHRQVFVTYIASERAVVHLPISRRQRRREGREVKEKVVATALVLGAELWKGRLDRIGANDTWGAGICIRISYKRVNIKWRSRCACRRAWNWCVNTGLRKPTRAEKHARKQTAAAHAAGKITAAIIKSTKGNKESIGRNVPVSAEKTTSALPEIGNDNDICLVVARAGFDPCLPLTHVVGGAQIRIAVLPANL